MYQVVDEKTYEVMYVGTEDECVEWLIDNKISGAFIERVRA